MPGKRIQIDEETWQQLGLLGHDQMNYRCRIADGLGAAEAEDVRLPFCG